jgi:hypothetical protein
MAAPTAPPRLDEVPTFAEDEILDAYLELEDAELAWLGYANEAQVQAELATALDVTGSS